MEGMNFRERSQKNQTSSAVRSDRAVIRYILVCALIRYFRVSNGSWNCFEYFKHGKLTYDMQCSHTKKNDDFFLRQ